MATEFNIQPPRWEVVNKTESDEPVWLVQRTDSLGRTRRAIVSRTSIHAADTEQTAAFHNRARVRDDGLRFIGTVSRHPHLMTYTDQWAVLQDSEWPYRCDYYLMTDALPTLAQVCRDRARKQPELIRLDSDPDVAARQLEQYQASLRLSEEDILRLGTQIYEALKVCLENELTAVPVTPDNIYMDEDGNFLLGCLFGMSDLRYNAFEKLGRVMYRLVEDCDPDEDRNFPRHCGPELATFVHAALTDSLNDDLVALLTGAPQPEAPEAEPEASEEENTVSTAALWRETASRLVSVLSRIQAKKAEAAAQSLRNAYSHTTPGPDCRVLVFARGKAAEEALAAGADYVGGPELAQKIQDEGWYDFDVVIATPDMMGIVGRLGALLDALGLFPSITGGTITTNAAAAVRRFKNSPTHVDPPATPVTQPPKKQEVQLPKQPKHCVPLAVGCEHIVGLKNDGTLITASEDECDQCEVSDWTQIISIAAGNFFTVGLKEDGTMVTAGDAFYDPNNFAEWNHLQAVAAGGNHLVALKEDGSVLAVGDNRQKQCNVAGWQQIRAIAAANHHTVGVMHDGTVVATGGNRFGECDVFEWNRITAIATGDFHTVGLKEDGTVTAIGNDCDGQCRTEGWNQITAIAAGSYYTVGLRADGTVVAIGENGLGQCNVRNWKNIVAIAAKGAVTLGLRADGAVLCTEADYDTSDWNDIRLPGQKPVAEEAKKPPVQDEPVVISRRKPAPVPGPGCRVLVFARGQAIEEAKAAGADYVGAEDLARKIQDEGWDEFDVVIAHPNTMGIVGTLARPLCDLGLMPSPKLGTVTTDVAAAVRKYKGAQAPAAEPAKEEPKKPVITPVSIPKPPKEPVPLSIAAQIRRNAMMKAVIAAGRNHSVALSTDGTVKAVGSNQYGQCSANGWKGMTAVAAGGNHTVALRGNGRVLASGNNQHNQCSVVNWISISQIAAGEAHTVGLKADGTVMAIGSQDSGQCNVMGWRNVGAIAAGAKHTVALQLDGTVLATGSRASHQCDVGDWNQIVAIAAGDWHTVGLRADGTVVAVGNNISGQCRVQNWSGIIAIAAGTSHTIGLKKDGTVVSAGNCRTVDGWRNVIAIAAGGNHSLGLRADGTVLAAGMNQNKECAVQDWKDVCVPASKTDSRTSDYTEIIRTKVKAASTIAASSDHAAFVTKDGHIHCVGKNQFFQCDTKDWKNMKAVAVGNSHTVGLMEDGTVKAVGKNITGQCKVSLWHNITQISACGDRTMGLRSNGTVAAAGIPTDSAEYKAISTWRDIVAVVAGYSYTFGLKADGTLVTAGSANAGQCDVADWKDIVAVSAGLSITVGLKADGTVVTAGKPPIKIGGTDVSDWREIDAVIADGYNVIGIRKDGSVICTGDTGMNPTKKAVSEWRQVVAIARGNLQIIGLNSSGKLMAASVGAKHPYDVSKLTNVRVCGEAKTANGDVFWHRASLI